MRTQDVDAAIAQALGTIAHHLIALALVDGVRQRVRAQRRVFFHRAVGLRPIRGDAAGINKLLDVAAGAVDDADRFHHARGAGNVDLPHPLDVENAGLLRIEYEGEMHDRLHAGGAQQLDELQTTGLAAQVHLLKAGERGFCGWAHVYAHHAKFQQKRKQPGSQIS